jgi:hypothetical protein
MKSLIEDEIVSIEECGEFETMDIEVEGNHLFFANDILTHNSAYDEKEEVTLANMSESIKKVEHSDHVSMIKNKVELKDERDPRSSSEFGEFKISIGKNRSGPKNVFVLLKSCFSKFKIFDDSARDHVVPFITAKENQQPDAFL